MWGSGFITQIIYATGNNIIVPSNALVTMDGSDLLTEDGQPILTEVA